MDKKYYEKVPMKGKEVEDVFGGSKEFENADTVASESSFFFSFSFPFIMAHDVFSFTAQCPAENCGGDRAYFFQLQIRSADEPMTTFLKVCFFSITIGL